MRYAQWKFYAAKTRGWPITDAVRSPNLLGKKGYELHCKTKVKYTSKKNKEEKCINKKKVNKNCCTIRKLST